MKTSVIAARIGIGVAVIGLVFPPVISAQQCPPELAEARSKIATMQTAAKKTQAAKDAPRTLAGAKDTTAAPRAQDIQAPRGQSVQAPRGQDIQAPRGQDIQAPRGQDPVQAPRGQASPRGQDVQAPRGPDDAKLKTAGQLVIEAERACKAGNMALSKEKATAALDAVK